VELLLQFGVRRDVIDNENKMPLHIVEKATPPDAKERLRILQTFGMAGYQAWQPPDDTSSAADDAPEVDFNETASSRRESTVSSRFQSKGHSRSWQPPLSILFRACKPNSLSAGSINRHGILI
jgi:hypothetical protein